MFRIGTGRFLFRASPTASCNHSTQSGALRANTAIKLWHRMPRNGWIRGVGCASGLGTLVFLSVASNSKPLRFDSSKQSPETAVLEYPANEIESMSLKTGETPAKSSVSSADTLVNLLGILSEDATLVAAIIVASAATAAVGVELPVRIGSLVGAIQENTDFSEHIRTILGLIAIQGLLTCVNINLVTVLGERVSLRLKHKLYTSLLYQDMSFFDSHMQGEVVGRLTQDTSEFKHTFKLVITQGLKCATQIIFTALQLLRVSQKLSLALISTMPLIYIVMNLYGIYLRSLSKCARVTDSTATTIASECISSIRTVRAFAAEDRELDAYMCAVQNSTTLYSTLGFHIGIFQGVTNTAVGGMVLIVLGYGGSLVANGEMTGAQLMTYMMSTQNVQKSLSSIAVLFGQTIKAMGSAARIFEYIQLQPTITSMDTVTPDSFQGSVVFKNVSFTYPTRPDQPVLVNFSLDIPKGKIVALCGASGSGKSTVGQLLERFYDVDEGCVLVDGVNVRDLDPRWIRNHVGYINQEPVLFATSIYENIRYGAPNATREQVEEAARQANAEEFIDSFPKGYETVVGERGVTLSGGQKQRIAIARAILKNPEFLILDEATSALDTNSERIVQDALEKLMKGRTVLVIAHRLSTIQNADLIVVLSADGKESRRRGNVVEIGTHADLLKMRGAYHRLYQQLGGASQDSGAFNSFFSSLIPRVQ